MRTIFLILAVATIATFAGCTTQAPDIADFPAESIIEIGEGETVFQLIADNRGEISVWSVATNEETVGAALLTLDLIAGEVGAFGLFVTTVNGITATGNAWWGFYIGDEMSMTGVDQTPAIHSETYAFVLTE
ncbi:MAG: hypothetical protein FWC70_00590 [Defluviitaleaceae bacterium]|nr:hypothetical protein [Defluviitaleaceae bacterium]